MYPGRKRVQFYYSCVHVSRVSSLPSSLHFQQCYMVSGVIVTCVVAACLSVRVFPVALSKSFTNVASMPSGEGESSKTTPTVLQNVTVPFPSKLETKGNMASNWKCFQRVWSNLDLKVDGGQLESLPYFDHHTHFTTCTVITYRVIICCKYTFLPMLILCK